MPDRFVGTSAVAYGMERMNRKVSKWMRGLNGSVDDGAELPFIATRGYDSVVWNRLYSRDAEDREDFQMHQASNFAFSTPYISFYPLAFPILKEYDHSFKELVSWIRTWLGQHFKICALGCTNLLVDI